MPFVNVPKMYFPPYVFFFFFLAPLPARSQLLPAPLTFQITVLPLYFYFKGRGAIVFTVH